MITEIPNPFPDRRCFFCGENSEGGVHLRFFRNGETREVCADYIPETRFVGQGTILHGGIQAGMLDEIMGWTGFAETGALAVTTKLEVEYLSPVYVDGTAIRLSCRMVSDDGRKMVLEARIVDGNGTECTRATGKFHKVSAEKYDALVRRISR